MKNTYIVTVRATPDGPDEALRIRFATCAAFRLTTLEDREGYYPKVGEYFDMLDNLSGPFLWDMSDEDIDKNPPSRIDYQVLAVEPAIKPETSSEIRVEVAIVH